MEAFNLVIDSKEYEWMCKQFEEQKVNFMTVFLTDKIYRYCMIDSILYKQLVNIL